MNDWFQNGLRNDALRIGTYAVAALVGALAGILLFEGLEALAEYPAGFFSNAPAAQEQIPPDGSAHPAAAGSTAARRVSLWPVDSTYAVATDGPTVYYGDGSYLYVADFFNPQRPIQKGRVALPATLRDVASSGNHVYVMLSDSTAGGPGVASGVFGVRAVDVSDPSAPRVVGAFDAEGPVEEIAVSGSHAYVASGKRGLRVIDLSDPRRMREVGAYVPASAGPASETNGVAVSGGYAYLAAGEAGLRVVDVSDPTTPSLRYTYHIGGVATDVAVSGVHAFLAWTARSIKDPDGSLNSDWFDQGLLVFDLSHPARPKRVSALANGPFPGDVWAGGARVYFDTGLDGIRVFDVSEAPTLRRVGSFASIVSDVAATSTRVYLAKGTKGLYVWERPWQARSRKDDGSKTLSGTPSRK